MVLRQLFYSLAIIGLLLSTGCTAEDETTPPSPGPSSYKLEQAFPSLTFERPVDLQHAPGTPGRLFIVEQPGVIKVIRTDQQQNAGAVRVVLDIRNRVNDEGNEEGLLGLAFHPRFQENRLFYVNYTAASPRRSVIAEYRMGTGDDAVADPASERILMEVPQPFSNHNGGQVLFGPDGYLYIGLGDGGSGGDPQNNGQNLRSLLGKLLRIDVNTRTRGQYGIPADNPFINRADAAPEVFAYGLRNPWRFSFDAANGTLWVADVGQNKYEEVNKVVKGGNYGWRYREAAHCFNPERDCPTENLIDPVWEYGRDKGASITGGFVYRGTQLPGLVGRYLCADFVTGRIWALDGSSNPVNAVELANTGVNISSFGIDEKNELYLLSLDGRIHRLVAGE